MSTEPVEPPQRVRSIVGQDRDYISFSAIRAYQACPLRYFFKYVEGLPEESVAATLVFGAALGLLFAYFIARMQGKYYFEIMLPGAIVGLLTGYATARYGRRARPAEA